MPKLPLVSSNTWVTQIYTGSCTLSFLHLQSLSYAEASCFCLLLFCLTHRHADILLEYQSQLRICLKDYPLSFLCTHCDCHNGKLESDTRAFLSPQPGTLNQALKDVEALVDKEVDGSVHSVWLMAEWVHDTPFCHTVSCSCCQCSVMCAEWKPCIIFGNTWVTPPPPFLIYKQCLDTKQIVF